MFASCPKCLQQFRIQAEQLAFAAGRVKCGACGHEFDALCRLSDLPLTPDKIKREPLPEAGAELDISLTADQATKPKEEKELDVKAMVSILSEEFRADPVPPDNTFATAAWGMGTCLLASILMAQLAWFNRDQLLSRYPRLDPLVRVICTELPCEMIRHKNLSRIKLLNRDVRSHPLYAESLLINATIVNRSKTVQPFPKIQLALFDTAGEIISFREFDQDDYLDNSIDIQAGMVPESPVHFVLEAAGATGDVVGFEFHFL